jgi:hypothetical protein
MAAIPADNYIRLMLDDASPAEFDRLNRESLKRRGESFLRGVRAA